MMTVAKNATTNNIRRDPRVDFDSESMESLLEIQGYEMTGELTFDSELKDDQLKLMFVCCHPVLSPEARLALTLKVVCGLSVSEIARGLLATEETVAQRIVRAKQKIIDEKLKFEVPSAGIFKTRLDSVLDVLYLLFNEGYSATQGDQLICRDLCLEAIRQVQILSEHPSCRLPKVFALLALMHFQVSRFDARLDADGDLLLLEDQDRQLWDQSAIERGFTCLNLAAAGDEFSEFHIQAGIASCHADAPSHEEADWERIVNYYDLLAMRVVSPVVALNRAVAMAMAKGVPAGLREIKKIEAHPSLKNYYLLPASIAELYFRRGDYKTAGKLYERALAMVVSEPEKRQMQKRIAVCKKRES